ncbi:MAG: hypothetical protein JWP96_568 [Polaromonas sp.]|nr:hypothetical protein [Polaromonas sp.]
MRRLRLRLSVGVMLVVCLLLIVSLGTVSARIRAQPIDPLPMPAAPLRLQADDRAASRGIHRLKTQANAAGKTAHSGTKGRSVPQAGASASAAQAAWLLGLIYLHGSGVARDPIQAALWFERARARGEPMSSAGLAWCDIEGCKGPPDTAGARRWIAQLRGIDPARADYLEWVIQSRLLPVQIAAPQPEQATQDALVPPHPLLLRSAQKGNVNARMALGMQHVATGHLAAAQAYFRAASPRSAAAAANLALISDRMKATTAAATIFISADELLINAQRLHRGEDRPADPAQAIRLYRLAQDKGSAEAREMLALIYSRSTPIGEVDAQWMQALGQLNLSKDAPLLQTVTSAPRLQCEPSPLFDLLPALWRKRTQPVSS